MRRVLPNGQTPVGTRVRVREAQYIEAVHYIRFSGMTGTITQWMDEEMYVVLLDNPDGTTAIEDRAFLPNELERLPCAGVLAARGN